MVSVAQSPVVLKMQGAWGAKDIFNEMAEEYVKRVNEMAGGRLRIDYLVAGAVVKPFEVMDATSKGVLDACHGVPVYWYGKSKVASLFGSGPINGCDAPQTLAWIYRGGGLELYNELLEDQPRRRRLLRDADADPAAGLVQEADQGRQGTARA
jgi:TRAP-type mannitol/chloroaromatic compound transport system substrate-binding protein